MPTIFGVRRLARSSVGSGTRRGCNLTDGFGSGLLRSSPEVRWRGIASLWLRSTRIDIGAITELFSAPIHCHRLIVLTFDSWGIAVLRNPSWSSTTNMSSAQTQPGLRNPLRILFTAVQVCV